MLQLFVFLLSFDDDARWAPGTGLPIAVRPTKFSLLLRCSSRKGLGLMDEIEAALFLGIAEALEYVGSS